MIKIFRNLPSRWTGIRKKIVQEGKIPSYLNFEIGKTQLIVIGILDRLNVYQRHNNQIQNKKIYLNLKNLKRNLQENWGLIDVQR